MIGFLPSQSSTFVYLISLRVNSIGPKAFEMPIPGDKVAAARMPADMPFILERNDTVLAAFEDAAKSAISARSVFFFMSDKDKDG